jgi:hypothetical protein
MKMEKAGCCWVLRTREAAVLKSDLKELIAFSKAGETQVQLMQGHE